MNCFTFAILRSVKADYDVLALLIVNVLTVTYVVTLCVIWFLMWDGLICKTVLNVNFAIPNYSNTSQIDSILSFKLI